MPSTRTTIDDFTGWAGEISADSDSDENDVPFRTLGSRRLSSWDDEDARTLRGEIRRLREARRELEPRDEPSGRMTLQQLRRSLLQEAVGDGNGSSATSATMPAASLGIRRSPNVTAALTRLIERQRLERRTLDRERDRLHVIGNSRMLDSRHRTDKLRHAHHSMPKNCQHAQVLVWSATLS